METQDDYVALPTAHSDKSLLAVPSSGTDRGGRKRSMSSQESSWARTTTWLVAANVLRNVGLLVILLVLARLTDPDTVGHYALALALTTPLFAFAQLGLRNVYLTVRTIHRFSSYLRVQLIAIALALVASVAVALVAAPRIVIVVALVAVIKSVDVLSDLFAAPLQRFHRAGSVFVGFLATAVIGSLVVSAVLAATRSLEAALAALAVANVVVGLVGLGLPARSTLARHADSEAYVHTVGADHVVILRVGVMTGVSAVMLALVPTLPQYFLAGLRGPDAVGYFAVVAYLLAIADIFTGTLSQAWIPHSRRAFEAEGRSRGEFLRTVSRTIARWVVIYLPGAGLALWCASGLLPLTFGPEYILPLEVALPLWVAIAVLPVLHFGGIAVTVRNLYAHNITLSAASAATALVACASLVPTFGVAGALWATAAALVARAAAAVVILVVHERHEVSDG